MQTAELGLDGDQPEIVEASASHGELVMADGHAAVLGLQTIGGRLWAVCESGLFVHDAKSGKFAPVLKEEFRSYWKCTAAVADDAGVWFGGDSGTISRFDRKDGVLRLVGVAPGRRVTGMNITGGLTVLTEKAPVCLPASLRTAAKLPDANILVFDGKQWSAGAKAGMSFKPHYSMTAHTNYLASDGRRIAFLKGVFQPEVLCEDPAGKALWLSTWEGIARVSLAEAAP
jgi:hypothetical protein